MRCRAEILSIELNFGNNRKLCISTCYRVGTLGVENHLEIEKYLRTLAKTKKFNKYILIGDFNLRNISWPEGDSHVELENKFLNTFADLGFIQLINKPTHEAGRVLDLLLTNTPELVTNLNILDKNDICPSDHFGITFILNISVKRISPSKRKMHNFKKANWEALNNDLNKVRWNEKLKYCDVDTAWSRFKATLFELCDHHIPKITIKSEFQPPWYDSDTHRLCREKERWRARYKKSNNIEHYNKFSQCRKDFKKLVREKMNSTFNDDSDPCIISKKFWKHVKSVSNSHRIPETVNYGQKFRNNKTDQAELFNDYFYDQFSSPSNYNININFQNDPWADFSITHQRIRSLLKNVNSNKAQGPDGIHGKILKLCAVSLAYPLSLIFRTSLKTGSIPCEWKMANVVPVFKKGSKTLVENYRPISLTCLCMKILEKVVRDELLGKINHLIDNSQHGFLPGKSCTTQMVPFCDSLAVTLNDASRTDVIYFDFAKAFDSVNHDIILHKLKHQFHIDGILLKFLINYLSNRQQCVVIGGAKSSIKPVTSGVPKALF